MGKFSPPKIEIPQPQPVQPANYIFPTGQQIYNPSTNTYTYQETPEAKALREEAEALKQEITASLGVTSEDRQAQLNKFSDLLTEEMSRTAVPRLSQELIGRGLGGSTIFKDSMVDLMSRISKSAALESENLTNIDEQLKLQQLAALESGLSPAYARALSSTGLAQQGTLQSQALQNAQLNALLNANIANAGLENQWMGQQIQGGSELAMALAMMAAMCLPAGTMIETDNGEVLVEDIKPGDMVKGGRVLLVNKIPVSRSHKFYKFGFDNGEVIASLMHPFFDEIKSIDVSDVISDFTYDIYTTQGYYIVNGVNTDSTLRNIVEVNYGA